MTLEAGTKFGPYEILAPIGAGGMGEVYRARDTRLGRDVAIKVLPESFAENKERLARFEREARLLASLNHPNIAAIHELEESDGVRFLALEYVPGETLAERIKRGPIPIDEALPLFKQIAEGLEAAHEKGVIHRDLKPANIKVTPEGNVKVLDFGLAKAMAGEEPSQGLSESPTITREHTEAGVLLGTAPYMSPEQARGKAVDKRTDIWAFGCCLYESLTGKAAYLGDTVTDTIAKIVEREPDWDALPSTTPVILKRLIRRCLQKDSTHRLHDIADARIEIEEGASEPSAFGDIRETARSQRRWPVAWTLAALAALAVGIAVWYLKPPAPRPVTRFPLLLPQGERRTGMEGHAVALSPDGTHLVYVANGQLHLRAMDEMKATPIRGTEGVGQSPFFSPDGQWVGFHTGRQLRKVSVSGGAPVTLCEASNPRGASWEADDTIVFGQNPEGILRVSPGGGTPEVLVPGSTTQGLAIGPQILPGGESLLFTIGEIGSWDQAQIVVQSLTTGERQVLIEGGTDARYVSTGHLVYAFQGSLLAVPFDAARLELTGAPVSLVDNLATGRYFGSAHFSFSDTGSLVYVDKLETEIARTLVWVNREGREQLLPAEPRLYAYPRISPDGTRVALDIRDLESDIWVWDLARETLTRLTFDARPDVYSIWTPDGRRIVFSSRRGGVANLFWETADGTGAGEQLTDGSNNQYPHSISPDGKQLVFREQTAESGYDLRVLSLEGEHSSEALVATEFNERNGEVSPNGRWLAYQSDESGQDEIYVRPFPNVNGGRWQISTGGGTRPLWGPDGGELFYLESGGRLTAVPIETDPSFTAGSAEILFEETYYAAEVGRTYDISPDGRRFLMIKESEADTAGPMSMTVVLNWFEELKRLVPKN